MGKGLKFDVDIGVGEPVYSVAELLRLAQDAIKRKDYTCAHGYLERTSRSTSGMLHYAGFLMAYLPADMKEGERVAKIEELLLYVEKNGSPPAAGKACATLADFYRQFQDRPLRRLGYSLRASRLGESVDEQVVKNLRQGISIMDISQPQKDLLGAYIVGVECSYYLDNAMVRWSQMFLRAVAESDSPLAGPAALQLADLLQEDVAADKTTIAYWHKRAAECGNPEVLKKLKNGGTT